MFSQDLWLSMPSAWTESAFAAGQIVDNEEMAIIGNTFPQGSTSDDVSVSKNAEVTKLTNSYNIIKDMYQVNGSQATNIGYINVGGGDYRWYIKGEMETRARFLDKREMMMLFSEKTATSGTIASQVGGVAGSEGYFAAVAARGITATGDATARIFDSIETLDNLLISLDKEGAPAEYAMYLDRRTSLDIDDMLANGTLLRTQLVWLVSSERLTMMLTWLSSSASRASLAVDTLSTSTIGS